MPVLFFLVMRLLHNCPHTLFSPFLTRTDFCKPLIRILKIPEKSKRLNITDT